MLTRRKIIKTSLLSAFLLTVSACSSPVKKYNIYNDKDISVSDMLSEMFYNINEYKYSVEDNLFIDNEFIIPMAPNTENKWIFKDEDNIYYYINDDNDTIVFTPKSNSILIKEDIKEPFVKLLYNDEENVYIHIPKDLVLEVTENGGSAFGSKHPDYKKIPNDPLIRGGSNVTK